MLLSIETCSAFRRMSYSACGCVETACAFGASKYSRSHKELNSFEPDVT